MLDRYVQGTVDRISPEAPVPIIHVKEDRAVPGGSCNVASNVVALGGQSILCGVLGSDTYGKELAEKLRDQGVDISGVFISDEVETIVKTRVLADNQQICRVDREALNHGQLTESEAFDTLLKEALSTATAAILEDYGKGAVQPAVTRRFIETCRAMGIPVGYDPKDNHAVDVRGITLATPNRKEAFYMSGVPERDVYDDPQQDTALLEVGRHLLRQWEPEFVLVTLGPQGMMMFESKGDRHHVPTRAKDVFDVSGAGDTVIAVCLLALASGATHVEAAELANYAAGVVVAKLGTATCSPEELLAVIP